MGTFDNIKPNNYPDHHGVHGKSLIDHRKRCKLGLSTMAYCIMLALDDTCIGNKIQKIDPWDLLGIDEEPFNRHVDVLTESEFIVKGFIGAKWRKEHPQKEENFDDLWNLFKKGTKSRAIKNYKQVIKSGVSHQHLMERRKAYCDWKASTGTAWQFYMGLDAWLNPENEIWDNPLPTDEKDEQEYQPGFQ